VLFCRYVPHVAVAKPYTYRYETYSLWLLCADASTLYGVVQLVTWVVAMWLTTRLGIFGNYFLVPRLEHRELAPLIAHDDEKV